MRDVERSYDAVRLNEILNDPIVRRDVADQIEGALDLADAIADTRNILLMGAHGCCLFYYVMDCLYEVHTQILSSGRGEWACDFVQDCAEWMFTHSDALELITRVPVTHLGARALTKSVGATLEFTRNDCCIFRGAHIPVEIYSLRLQDWMAKATYLAPYGECFHDHLNAEAGRIGISAPPHAEDENHNQYVGACLKMFFGGQIQKAVVFYNRWAVAARHATISLEEVNPPVIKFDIGFLKINGEEIKDIEVIPCSI